MVTVRFSAERLVEASGVEVDVLKDALFRLKCEVEEADGELEIEVNPDRPDMFSVEGIARAVRGLMALELGWSRPEAFNTGVSIMNEAPPSRPVIAGAVIYGVNLDEESVSELMQFQEKLHDTLGRRRRKVAIGIHDLSKVKGRTLKYTLVSLDYEMVPLGYTKKIPVKDVLKLTEQGVKYGGLSLMEEEGSLVHPAILDEEGNIISLPPVINSDITKVEAGTKDLFIDVTGTDLHAVEEVLNVLVSNLLERKGARLGQVSVIEAGSARTTPTLKPVVKELSVGYVNEVLGTNLTIDDIAFSLLKMRHALGQRQEGVVNVVVPPFRVDVIAPIDLVEDVAIALGYDSPWLSPTEPPVAPTGELMVSTRLTRLSRDIMIGLGFTELMSYLLTSSRLLETLGISETALRIKNPVQADLDALRPSLVPSLLAALEVNVSRKKPIRLFEVGKVVFVQANSVEEDKRLGAALMNDSVSYEDIQAVAYSYLRALGLSPSAKPVKPPRYMIDGRTAELFANGMPIGLAGEVSPEILEALNISYPVAIFEISLNKVLEALNYGASGPKA
ncbi:MAG: phenylalanine--tRNA ligase subunit beta [Acidilobus sp.]